MIQGRPRVRVAHLITDLTTGGAERMLERLVLGMDRERFESLVISMVSEGTIGPRIRASGIPVMALGMRRGVPDLRSMTALIRALRAFRPDILQTWLYHADLLGLVAGKAAGTKRLYWNIRCSDLDLSSYPRSLAIVRNALAKLSRVPDTVIVNSEHGRLVHEQLGYRPRRWETIPNGFDTDVFRPRPELRRTLRARLEIPEDARVAGLVARYAVMKDHPNFLRAAKIIAAGDPLARFVLVGRNVDDRNDELSAVIKSLELRDRCILLGERRDIPELHAVFDVAVMSSGHGEGFPNAIGEAMACGVPCAATDIGDARRLIGDTGRIAPPHDANALATAMTELLTLPADERAALGESARKRIIAMFGLRAAIGRYETLYSGDATGREPGGEDRTVVTV